MTLTQKQIGTLHQVTLWLILILGYLTIFMMGPVIGLAVLGMNSWKNMWIQKIFDPLTIPGLILFAVTVAFISFYGYGYLYKGYPPFLKHGKQLEDERRARRITS